MRKIKTLKKNYEFKNVLSKGKFFIGKQVSIYVLKNKKKCNVIGIAVSTKACGAVSRNRIKRLIRENYRIIFLWNKKNEPKDANYYVIKNDIEKLLKKAELLS